MPPTKWSESRTMNKPTHEALCKLAYRFWEERGCPDGSPEVDWERAERELGRYQPAADEVPEQGGAGR